jgi:hypothetical protein
MSHQTTPVAAPHMPRPQERLSRDQYPATVREPSTTVGTPPTLAWSGLGRARRIASVATTATQKAAIVVRSSVNGIRRRSQKYAGTPNATVYTYEIETAARRIFGVRGSSRANNALTQLGIAGARRNAAVARALETSRRTLTPGSTAGCRRYKGHFIPPGPLHPEVRGHSCEWCPRRGFRS